VGGLPRPTWGRRLLGRVAGDGEAGDGPLEGRRTGRLGVELTSVGDRHLGRAGRGPGRVVHRMEQAPGPRRSRGSASSSSGPGAGPPSAAVCEQQRRLLEFQAAPAGGCRPGGCSVSRLTSSGPPAQVGQIGRRAPAACAAGRVHPRAAAASSTAAVTNSRLGGEPPGRVGGSRRRRCPEPPPVARGASGSRRA